MLSLGWFVLRAAFWLGLASLFVPGSLPFGTITANQVDSVAERVARDTLTPLDRVASWGAHRALKNWPRVVTALCRPRRIASLG